MGRAFFTWAGSKTPVMVSVVEPCTEQYGSTPCLRTPFVLRLATLAQGDGDFFSGGRSFSKKEPRHGERSRTISGAEQRHSPCSVFSYTLRPSTRYARSG